MKWIFFIILSFVAIILQASFVAWPLIVGIVVSLAVIEKSTHVFFYAFLCGLIADMVLFLPIGASCVFLTVLLCIIFLYQRKFEIRTMPFVFFASLIGSAVYLILFGYREILLSSGIVALLSALCFFAAMKLFGKKRQRSSEFL